MTKEELMELIDIEDGAGFTYFENLAAIIEADVDIPASAIFQVLQDVDMKTFSELCESYFYDIMENMPEDVDVYNMLEAEKRNLIAMAESVERLEEGALSKLSDELERFHEHFVFNTACEIMNNDEQKSTAVSLRDALYDHRISRLGTSNKDYNIAPASNYEISEYIVNLNELS